jgi:hypothetical protein
MASASRNIRRKRRIKRNLSITRRALFMESVARAKTSVVFYAVLSKLGGEIELSKTDIDTAAQNLTKLSYEIEPSAVEGFFMVKIVTAEKPEVTPEVADEASAKNVEPIQTLGIAPNDIVDEAHGINHTVGVEEV